MSIQKVQQHFNSKGFTGEILIFEESSATVELAAEKVGTLPERIAKTLSFYDPENPEVAVLVVAAGDAKVNGGKFKRTFGGKPRMLAREDVESFTGYAVGGVCPFDNPSGARVFLDESLRRFESVYPAGGSANSAVEIKLTEIEGLSNSIAWVDVATGWQDEQDEG